MRQLTIDNLRLAVDASGNDAEKEAHQILAIVNDTINKIDGCPALFITTAELTAAYEETEMT